MYSMYEFLWIFFIYAFLGWCTEVAFAALVTGKFVNRGFLNGPVCPIYGFGVVIVVACLTPLEDNTLLLFIGSVLLTSLLEWITGFVLEKIFHERWWDYSDEPFNLGGYICLRFSLAWGIACLLVMKIIHPSILTLIRWVPHTLGIVLLCVSGVTMGVDLAATVKSIAKLNNRLKQIDELAAKIRETSNGIGESLADHVLDLSEKGNELKDTLTEKSEDVKESLSDLKESWTEKSADVKESLADLKESWTEKSADVKESLSDLKETLTEKSENWKNEQTENLEELRRKLDALISGRDRGEHRLLRAFPTMRSERYKEALESWKRRQEEKK